MTEHLPECPILKPCCDDEEFPEHGFCGNFVGRCLHCWAECICDALRACEARVSEEQCTTCCTRAEQMYVTEFNAGRDQGYKEGYDAAMDDGLMEKQ